MPTAIERKQATENILRTFGLPVPDNIPELEEESEITLRTGQEVAERIIILTYVNCAAIEPEMRPQIISYLEQEGLFSKVSDQEKGWLEKDELTEEDATDMLWRAEAIWLLLWAINKVDQLQLPTIEVKVENILPLLPPFMQGSVDFIASASTRNKSDILDQCDFLFRLAWIMKEWDSTTMNEMTFSHGITFERHFAINWVTGIAKDWY